MHKVLQGVHTNFIWTTATQNVGQDALSTCMKKVKP